MNGLGSELAPEFLAACQAGAAEACEALNRCLALEAALTVGEPLALQANELPPNYRGPGLALVFTVQGEAAVLFLSEASGFLPDWYAAQDATSVSKLATLAQELGMLLFPETHCPEDFAAGKVQAIERSLVLSGANDLCGIPLEIKSAQTSSEALLVWPIPQPQAILSANQDAERGANQTNGARGANATHPSSTQSFAGRDLDEALPAMPPYIRSLLRIKVKLSVVLSATRQPVQRILDLAPGSIIQFEKSCDEPLELRVGDTCVAVGEAVKSGDKYGLRLTSMVMPEERFVALGKTPRKAS